MPKGQNAFIECAIVNQSRSIACVLPVEDKEIVQSILNFLAEQKLGQESGFFEKGKRPSKEKEKEEKIKAPQGEAFSKQLSVKRKIVGNKFIPPSSKLLSEEDRLIYYQAQIANGDNNTLIQININSNELTFEELSEEFARVKKEVKEIYQSEIWKEIPLIKSKSHENPVKYPKLTLDHCMDFVLEKQPSRDNEKCQNVSGKLSELFRSGNKRVLILGEMGSGKSIFSKSIAYQWSKEKFEDFDWVFHVDLPECIKIIEELEIKENITCYDLIRLKYFYLSNGQNDILSKLLRLKKVLIIIDGYDEAVSRYPHLTNRLLGQDELYYLVCSRPEGADELLKLKKYVVVKNIGTAYANFHHYIKAYFEFLQQPSYAKELLDWLEKQEDLMKVCTIPIYLEMLCELWKCNREEVRNKSYLSKANLYDHFVNNILHQHLLRTVDEGCKADEDPLVIMSRIFLEELL